ncbi:MAG TPA: hypothetical protein VIT64_17290 [Ilumatobacteraceae bacterium]
MGPSIVTAPATSLADLWAGLVSSALVGTERRAAPGPIGGQLDDVTRLRAHHDDSEVVLDRVAAITAMRRAGLRPGPVVPGLVTAPDDPRPVCRPAAVERLHDLLEQWPVLVDQWLAELDRGGWRLPPDAVVELLGRWRNEPERRALVHHVAGPIATWLVELFPAELAPARSGRARPASGDRPASGERRLPPDIAPFVALDAGALAAALASGLEEGALGVRHRPALIDLLLQVPPDRLATVADALERAGTNPTTMGLALSLADLARTRLAMLEELTP